MPALWPNLQPMPGPDDILPEISTAAEALERSALHNALHEVHADPARKAPKVPAALEKPESRSPARWAYERLVLYIRNFEANLAPEEEVALAFTGGDTGVIRIEGMGYFDPDIISFYGTDPAGGKTQIVQHVSRLSVSLRALPRALVSGEDDAEETRIGFRLVRDLEDGAPAGRDSAPPIG